MATLAVQPVVADGLAPTFSNTAAGGDKFVNPDGKPFAIFRNVSGSAITVTAVTTKTVNSLAVADKTFTVPANGFRICPPFSKGLYNNADDEVNFTYSTHTDLSVAIVRQKE